MTQGELGHVARFFTRELACCSSIALPELSLQSRHQQLVALGSLNVQPAPWEVSSPLGAGGASAAAQAAALCNGLPALLGMLQVSKCSGSTCCRLSTQCYLRNDVLLSTYLGGSTVKLPLCRAAGQCCNERQGRAGRDADTSAALSAQVRIRLPP